MKAQKSNKMASPKSTVHHQWAGEKKPSMKRRCELRDYCERGLYMITIAIEGRQPLLGVLKGDPDVIKGDKAPHVELSPLGECVRKCWMDIVNYYPSIEPMKLCVMPDHIHGILFVHERQEKHLGHVINGFKIGCRKAARELGLITAALPQPTEHHSNSTHGSSLGSSSSSSATTSSSSTTTSSSSSATTTSSSSSFGSVSSVQYAAAVPQQKPSSHPLHGLIWEPGYNDRILLHKGQLGHMLAYLDDNPRRLLLKRRNPDYFTCLGSLVVAGIPMQAMGNRFLLDNPFKIQVQCSRRLSAEEIEKKKEAFLREAHHGAILVSPCISPGEQQIATAALTHGLPLIVLLLNGFSPFFKPKPRYLEACANGRLLMLAPFPYQNEKMENMRQRCLQLNAYAMEICKDE